MFFCIINIDLLDDDYFYRLILNICNEEICKNIIKRINNGEYNADFAKNCVYSEFSNNKLFLNDSTLILNENDAIKFLESFFKDYDNGVDFLIDNYKLVLAYFNDKVIDYYTDEDFSDY